MKTITLDDLSRKCGYFVNTCKEYCNNGYGCDHTENADREPENCTKHGPCLDWACPIAYRYDDEEDRGGGDAIMALNEAEKVTP